MMHTRQLHGLRLIYSSKIYWRILASMSKGWRISSQQLLDFILNWRHNSKVRITIIFLCTTCVQLNPHRLILHNTIFTLLFGGVQQCNIGRSTLSA